MPAPLPAQLVGAPVKFASTVGRTAGQRANIHIWEYSSCTIVITQGTTREQVMMTLIKNGVMATVDLDRNDSENTGAVPLPSFPPILSQISRRFDRR